MFAFASFVTPTIIIFVLLVLVNASFSVPRQYERSAGFTVGRFSGARQIVRVDLRTMANGHSVPTLSGSL